MKPIDEGLAPVRAVRAAISKEFGHDASRYVAHLRAAQSRYAKQVAAYRRARKPKRAAQAAAN